MLPCDARGAQQLHRRQRVCHAALGSGACAADWCRSARANNHGGRAHSVPGAVMLLHQPHDTRLWPVAAAERGAASAAADTATPDLAAVSQAAAGGQAAVKATACLLGELSSGRTQQLAWWR